MHLPSPWILVLAIGLVASATGCSSTKLVNQWENPQYVPARFNRILVIGVSRQPGLRRTFEDEFTARLQEAGVDAVPSYRHIPEDGPVDEARLQEAVRQANADGILMTRLVRVERKTEVSPGYYTPAPGVGWGFYPWYSAAWLGYYEPPRVYQYDVYISETSLYDVKRNQLVWSGTVQTKAPRDLNKEIQRYVETVIKALKKEQVLA
jgi:uncharacterized protein DUF4136